MGWHRDDIELFVAGCRPLGVVALLANVERALSEDGLACVASPLAAWQRRRSRTRLFRSWLKPD